MLTFYKNNTGGEAAEMALLSRWWECVMTKHTQWRYMHVHIHRYKLAPHLIGASLSEPHIDGKYGAANVYVCM